MEPGPGADASPEMLRVQERNAFYETLSVAAKERFLAALSEAEERGLDEEAAWREAVVAAEAAYGKSSPAPR
jgi:hypothetical protein